MADDKPIKLILIKDLISEDGTRELTASLDMEPYIRIGNGGDTHVTLCGPASVR